MDIDLLSKMVKELILDNDEVTLPGVGTFVTEIIPSTFSDKGYTINPPYRRLYFRQKQNDEDTQLSDFYAKSNNIDKETARLIIADFLREMKEILLHKRIIVFPGLGRLRATKENNLFFIADEELDIYPEGFGLEPISLKTHQETKEEVAQALDDLKSIMTPAEETQEEAEAQETVTGEEIALEETKSEDAIQPEEKMEMAEEQETAEEQEMAEEVQSKEDRQLEKEVPETIQPEEVIPEEQKTEIVPEKEEMILIDAEDTILVDAEVPSKPEEAKKETKEGAEKEAKKKPGLRKAVWVIIIILIICIVALTAFVLIGRLAPNLLDNLLYSPEELQILRQY